MRLVTFTTATVRVYWRQCKYFEEQLIELVVCVAGTYFDGQTLFVNGSTCNGDTVATNPPIVVDLPFDRSLPARVVPPEEQQFSYQSDLLL